MRTTITLQDDVLHVARSLANARSISLGDAISELVRRGLQTDSSLTEESGFPVFRVSAGARPITLEDVKSAEDES
ncbi:MAG TPA: DUF2191 domain-containing protein [Armatimonadota bacterium]|nr:DUF2191 domain-containing protein [Armatimonadota bacterium]